jgi:hypothetical protein
MKTVALLLCLIPWEDPGYRGPVVFPYPPPAAAKNVRLPLGDHFRALEENLFRPAGLRFYGPIRWKFRDPDGQDYYETYAGPSLEWT